MMEEPVPFQAAGLGRLFHGTKAKLATGDLLVPCHNSNFSEGRAANHVYVTGTLDAAAWGAELAVGEGRGRIYIVEALGGLEGELPDWLPNSPEKLQAVQDGLAVLKRSGPAVIED